MMAIAVNSISLLGLLWVTLTMLIFAVSFYCIYKKEERRILYSLFILIKTNKKGIMNPLGGISLMDCQIKITDNKAV